jgi:hypothetical protein
MLINAALSDAAARGERNASLFLAAAIDQTPHVQQGVAPAAATAYQRLAARLRAISDEFDALSTTALSPLPPRAQVAPHHLCSRKQPHADAATQREQ